MLPTQQGAFQLFRLFGITVFLHWSWFVVAAWRFQNKSSFADYNTPVFYVAEYLSLFLIVLMHEFGHSLACRQVGGTSDQIVLWPLGGVAYVRPPERPGAQLWSIAAGPLVNVALVPVLYGIYFLFSRLHWDDQAPEFFELIKAVNIINAALLVFNLFPIYPLDGGQILRSLLWYWLGRAKSLLVASGIGFVGVAALVVWAVSEGLDWWLLLMAAFIGMNCLQGWRYARAMLALESRPTRPEYSCPRCQQHPTEGLNWLCGRCQTTFDAFATRGVCPKCDAHYEETRCTHCGAWATLDAWRHTGARVQTRPSARP